VTDLSHQELVDPERDGTYPSSVSVAVIGGGVTGCSIAYQLAKRGVDVALFEMEHLAWGASGRNAGNVGIGTRYAGGVAHYRQHSMDMLPEIERDLGEVEFVQSGGLEVFVDRPGEQEYFARTQAYEDAASRKSLMDADEARAFLPLLSDAVGQATYSAENGHLWPFKLVHRFAAGALRLGARIFTGAHVSRIIVQERTVQGVEVDGQLVRARWVVNATNAWSGALAESAGLTLPVVPYRGQIVVTEARPSMLPVTMSRYADNSAHYWRQTPDGKFVIGGGRMIDEAGHNSYDRRNSHETLQRMLANVTEVMPMLASLRIVRTWAGIMGFTPDGKPYVGETERISGLVLAAGFNGSGMLWSPVVGLLTAEHIAGDSLTLALDEIHPDRPAGQLAFTRD
jgi:sarcosine oxidase, subunit beta